MSFVAISASPLSPSVVRVRFSARPDDNVLDTTQYVIGGAKRVWPTSVARALDEDNAVDITLSAPMIVGAWTILLGNITSNSEPLSVPLALTFAFTSTSPSVAVTRGARALSAFERLRAFLPLAWRGPKAEATLHALAEGDVAIEEQSIVAAQQGWQRTATGAWLNRHGEEQGVRRPENVGLPDRTYDRFITAMRNRLTGPAITGILESLWDPIWTRKYIDSAVGPFDVVVGDTLLVKSQGETVTVTFSDEDLPDTTAQSIALAIVRQSELQSVPLKVVAVDDTVRIFARRPGAGGSVSIVGGSAQRHLRFPLSSAPVPTGASLAVYKEDDQTGRLEITTSTSPWFLASGWQETTLFDIRLSGLNAANQGWFETDSVTHVYTGSAFLTTVYFANPDAITQTGPFSLDGTEIVIWSSPALNPPPVSVHAIPNTVTVTLPAAGGVQRTVGTGSYLPSEDDALRITSVVAMLFDANASKRRYDGKIKATFTGAHGLSVGDLVYVEGCEFDDGAVDAPNSASSGLLSTSQQLLRATADDPLVNAGRRGAKIMPLGSGLVVMNGRTATAGTISTDCTLYEIAENSVVEGRQRYSYTRTSLAGAGQPCFDFAAVSLDGAAGRCVVRIGGRINTTVGVGDTTDRIDRLDADSTVEVNGGTHPACSQAVAFVLYNDAVDGTEVVVVSGGLGDASATVEDTISTISTSSGGLVVANTDNDVEPRYQHAGCAVARTVGMWCGGTPNNSDPLDHTLELDVDGVGTVVGRLAIARRFHAVVSIGDGRALAIGGLGRNLTNETTDRVVGEVELYDTATKAWIPCGSLRYPRIQPTVWVADNKVWVWGGSDADTTTFDDIVQQVEFLDLVTNEWGEAGLIVPAAYAPGREAAVGVFPGTDVALVHGGTTTAGAAQTATRAIIPGALNTTGPRLEGLLQVDTVDSSTVATLAGAAVGYYSRLTDGFVYKMNQEADVGLSNFLFDPTGLSLGDGGSTLTTAIDRQDNTITLQLVDAGDFSDDGGWLVVDFGLETQEGPIPYRGKNGNTILLTEDAKFWLPHAVGAVVVPLVSNDAVTPGRNLTIVTDSTSLRRATERAMRDSVATGNNLDVVIAYPDVALREEDILWVWGG